MPYDRHTGPSLVSICNNRPTDSIRVIPYEDTLGSRQCTTEHSSTGGIETYTTLEYDSIGLLCYCEGSSMEISKHDSLIRLGPLNGTLQCLGL